MISFSTVYIFDEPEDQLFILNKLIILYCIEEHAPLRRVKFTRTPAPWMKELDTVPQQRDISSVLKHIYIKQKKAEISVAKCETK